MQYNRALYRLGFGHANKASYMGVGRKELVPWSEW